MIQYKILFTSVILIRMRKKEKKKKIRSIQYFHDMNVEQNFNETIDRYFKLFKSNKCH